MPTLRHNLLRSAVNRITNCDLSDMQWLQTTLTTKEGGLGVRRVASLALSAFLASAVSTFSLQELILGGRPNLPDTLVDTYRICWISLHGTPPVEPLSHKQSAWDRPGGRQVRRGIEPFRRTTEGDISGRSFTSQWRLASGITDHIMWTA